VDKGTFEGIIEKRRGVRFLGIFMN